MGDRKKPEQTPDGAANTAYIGPPKTSAMDWMLGTNPPPVEDPSTQGDQVGPGEYDQELNSFKDVFDLNDVNDPYTLKAPEQQYQLRARGEQAPVIGKMETKLTSQAAPEDYAAQLQYQQQQAQINAQKYTAEAAQWGARAETAVKLGDLAAEHHDAAKTAFEEAKAHMDQVERRLDDTINKALSSNVDPNRFFNNRGESARFTASMAIAVGAMNSAILGPGTKNYALDIINNAIERDMEAQKVNLLNLQNSASTQLNLLGELRNQFTDETAADTALYELRTAQALKQLEAAGSHYMSQGKMLDAAGVFPALMLQRTEARIKLLEGESTLTLEKKIRSMSDVVRQQLEKQAGKAQLGYIESGLRQPGAIQQPSISRQAQPAAMQQPAAGQQAQPTAAPQSSGGQAPAPQGGSQQPHNTPFAVSRAKPGTQAKVGGEWRDVVGFVNIPGRGQTPYFQVVAEDASGFGFPVTDPQTFDDLGKEGRSKIVKSIQSADEAVSGVANILDALATARTEDGWIDKKLFFDRAKKLTDLSFFKTAKDALDLGKLSDQDMAKLEQQLGSKNMTFSSFMRVLNQNEVLRDLKYIFEAVLSTGEQAAREGGILFSNPLLNKRNARIRSILSQDFQTTAKQQSKNTQVQGSADQAINPAYESPVDAQGIPEYLKKPE